MDKPGVIAQAVLGVRQVQRSLDQAMQITQGLADVSGFERLLGELTALPGAAEFAPLKAASRLQGDVAEAERAGQIADRAVQAQFIDDLLRGARSMGAVGASAAASSKLASAAKHPADKLAAASSSVPDAWGGVAQGGGLLGALYGVLANEARSGRGAPQHTAHLPGSLAQGEGAVAQGPQHMLALLAELTGPLAGAPFGISSGTPFSALLKPPLSAPQAAAPGGQRRLAAGSTLSHLVQANSLAAQSPSSGEATDAAATAQPAQPVQGVTGALLGMTLLNSLVSDWWPITQGVGASVGALDTAAGALAGAMGLPYRSSQAGHAVAAPARRVAPRAPSMLKPQRAPTPAADTLAALRPHESANDSIAPAVSSGGLAAPQVAGAAGAAPDDDALADQLNRALVEQAWRAGVDLS
jgi:hypothetical protein